MTEETPTAHLEVWFDRQWGVWLITAFDAEGNQTDGESPTFHRKADAIALARDLSKGRPIYVYTRDGQKGRQPL